MRERENLLEALDSFSNAPTYFRQILGSKEQSCDTGDDDELRDSETKQAAAVQTHLGSPSGQDHGGVLLLQESFSAIVEEEGVAGRKGGFERRSSRKWG